MNKKDEKGISLIALIIAIILLTILVGTSIGLIVNKGIYDNTKNVVNETKEQVNSQQQISDDVRNLYR